MLEAVEREVVEFPTFLKFCVDLELVIASVFDEFTGLGVGEVSEQQAWRGVGEEGRSALRSRWTSAGSKILKNKCKQKIFK